VHSQMVDFIETAQKRSEIPIFLAYSLGKAQEAMKILSERGYQLSVHGSICPIAEIYEEFGVKFNKWECYKSGNPEGKVLIVPPWVRGSRIVEKIPRKRIAILTGWAVDPGAKKRYGVDEVIPLSDHADFPELMEYVKKAQPQKVFTVHGFPKFVDYLKDAGFDAEPLKESIKVETSMSKGLPVNYDLFS